MKTKSNLAPGDMAAAGDLPRVLVDAMLGRLARWLRLIGYDALYARDGSDHQIAARARAEDRIVLTRDRELARRRGIRCLLIERQDVEGQLEEVWQALGPPPADLEPRCPSCNATLRPIGGDEARQRVPPYVYRTHEHFRYCAHCDQVYWRGSHWEDVERTIERLS
jgi:uncharacterized protein with PIN domain